MKGTTWDWFGQAGHFIDVNRCRYHLHTHVGGDGKKPHRYCVSTVGEYYLPDKEEPEFMGASTCRYETMVFRLDMEGVSIESHIELACERTDSRKDAAATHLRLCMEYELACSSRTKT